MANELKYRANPSTDVGLTLIGQVLNESGIQIGSNINFSEVGSTAFYQGDIPTLTAGTYFLDIYKDSVATANYESGFLFEFDGTQILGLADIGGGSSLTAAQVYAEFTSGGNEDVFKADVSNLLLASAYTAPDNATISANATAIGNIPTNALLTTDSRLDNLDATISSRSSHTAADIWSVTTRSLTTFGTLVADIVTAVWGATTRSLTGFGTLVSDIWSNTTRGLTEAVTASNMRGTDNALLVSSYTAPDNAAISANGLAIGNLNNLSSSEIVTALQAVADDFKADISGLETEAAAASRHTADIAQHTQTQSDVGEIASGNPPTPAEIYTFFTTGSNEDVFKADSVTVDLSSIEADLTTILSRLTAARSVYLDKLNVTGDLANTDNAASFQGSGSNDLSLVESSLENIKNLLILVSNEVRENT